MSSNSPVTGSSSAPLSAPLSDFPLDPSPSLEEKLRQMILQNSPTSTDQGRGLRDPPCPLVVPLSMPESPHYEGHSSLDSNPLLPFNPVASQQPHFNPLDGFGSPGIPRLGLQFGASPSHSHPQQLPPAHGLQFPPEGHLIALSSPGASPSASPSDSPYSPYSPNPYFEIQHQRYSHYGQQIPLQAQSQMSPRSPHSSQVPPHQFSGLRHPPHPNYGQPISPQFQEPLPPGQGGLHTLPQTVDCNANRGTVQYNSPTPQETSLEHFPPLGTERSKAVSHPPPQPHQFRTPQVAAHKQLQQQNRYQYHQPEFQPINRTPNPPPSSRATPRGPNHYPTPGKPRRVTSTTSEVLTPPLEQDKTLEEFSKRIIAEATPQESETAMKWKLLDRCKEICRRVYPQAELVPFGSLVTGFAITNSDIDVVLTTPDTGEFYFNSMMAGSSKYHSQPERLEQEFLKEGFEVTLLTKTRVPILKLVQKADDENPFELHCDIGFNNPLGVHNTRMLCTYAKCDSRVQDMVLFVKWWAKKKHINSPYHGTLSSYGYALMIIHFLTNIVKPPVLTNLQTRSIPEDTEAKDVFNDDGEGPYCIWYTKDIQSLPKLSNEMHIGQLLREFFEYYTYTFSWERDVVSIRTHGGLLTKEGKRWTTARIRRGLENDSQVKDRYLLAVEDPFETPHNVGRTCNVSGVRRIKEEFRKAAWLMRLRDGGKRMTDCLCLEESTEEAWVRREDQGNGTNGGDRGRVGPPGNGDYRARR